VKQSSAVAAPLSRQNIRDYAKYIREIVGLENQLYFPILFLLEMVMPQIDPEFSLEILPKDEMGEYFGLTCPSKHKIILREDVYDGAVNGNGMHRFTVAHEIGHYLLHTNRSVVLARNNPEERIPAYLDPEWQADCFAGELLMPAELIKSMNANEIAFACRVSLAAARTQLRKVLNEKRR